MARDAPRYILPEHSRGVAKPGSFKFGTIEHLRRRDGVAQRAEQFRIVSVFFPIFNEHRERERESVVRGMLAFTEKKPAGSKEGCN